MTTPRSQWLTAALRCLSYCVVLLLWTRTVLLEPLRKEAIGMVRRLVLIKPLAPHTTLLLTIMPFLFTL